MIVDIKTTDDFLNETTLSAKKDEVPYGPGNFVSIKSLEYESICNYVRPLMSIIPWRSVKMSNENKEGDRPRDIIEDLLKMTTPKEESKIDYKAKELHNYNLKVDKYKFANAKYITTIINTIYDVLTMSARNQEISTELKTISNDIQNVNRYKPFITYTNNMLYKNGKIALKQYEYDTNTNECMNRIGVSPIIALRKNYIARERDSVVTNIGLLIRTIMALPIIDKMYEIVQKSIESGNDIKIATHTIRKGGKERVISYYEDESIMKLLSIIVSIFSTGIPYPMPTMAVKNKGFSAVMDSMVSIALSNSEFNYIKTDIEDFFPRCNINKSKSTYLYYTVTDEAHRLKHCTNNRDRLCQIGSLFPLIMSLCTNNAKSISHNVTDKISNLTNSTLQEHTTLIDILSTLPLTQGMPGSSFIADLNMHYIDRQIWKETTRILNGIYMRWVDDIIVLYPSSIKSNEAMDILNIHKKVGKKGLSINNEKTEFGVLNSSNNNRLHWVGMNIRIEKEDNINKLIIRQKHRRKKDKCVRMLKQTDLTNKKEISDTLDYCNKHAGILITGIKKVIMPRIWEEARKIVTSDYYTTNNIIELLQSDFEKMQYAIMSTINTNYFTRKMGYKRRNRYAYPLLKSGADSKNHSILSIDDHIFTTLYTFIYIIYNISCNGIASNIVDTGSLYSHLRNDNDSMFLTDIVTISELVNMLHNIITNVTDCNLVSINDKYITAVKRR